MIFEQLVKVDHGDTNGGKETSMKRKAEATEVAEEGQKAPTPEYSGVEDGSLTKYSQNIDLSETFDLSMNNGKVYNGENKQVLFITLSKNAKIGRQLDRILKYIEDRKDNENRRDKPDKEIMLIATGESIQKMITIVEILKQKITQTHTESKSGKGIAKTEFQNTSIAKLPEYNKIMISGEVVGNDKIKLNYTQLNFIDYTLIEKQVSVRNKKQHGFRQGGKATTDVYKKDGLYDRDTLDEALKIDKLVKIPVMYIYMSFHRHEELSVRYVSKFKNLVSNGWSIQQS